MATFVATSERIWAAGLKLHCYTNSLSLELNADPVESTTFCSSGARDYRQGLKSWRAAADGFADFAAVGAVTGDLVPGEVIIPANMGSYFPLLIAPTGTEAEACYLADSVSGNFTVVSGAVGDMAGIHAEFFPSDRTVGHRIVRGRLDANRTATSSTNTTGAQTGAVSSTQTMWAVLQVSKLTTGAALAVVVQSDDNSGFTTPTDRITFTSASTRSGQWGSAAGAITDDWWRVKWTISGSTPSVDFAVGFGVL